MATAAVLLAFRLMSALASGLSAFLGVSSLATPGVPFIATLAYCDTAASVSLEEPISLLERLNSVLGELDSLGEVLGGEGLYRGFIAPSDWGEELDSLLEELHSFQGAGQDFLDLLGAPSGHGCFGLAGAPGDSLIEVVVAMTAMGGH